ncbi:hypothetical protein RBH26_15885 [Natronolimnohabitans sp. A-GB9]|uniref:hypothetical protein n=1 Tax=Natronolimnohabitans sp. A-GB9 TaxID=3069757 RepID=UPI0027B6A0AC|nr:hypothetical protein [Natronolimnohabitans sp. A-GB9]MDQ2051959.1 hypothetical protein [Natronolimnohabitans sp. A-GB9]
MTSSGAETPGQREIDQGVMFPYQYTPGSGFTIDESLSWRPQSLPETYETQLITYDYAQSYQAYLFTATASDETGQAVSQPGESHSLGEICGSPPETKRSYVTVGLENHGSGID